MSLDPQIEAAILKVVQNLFRAYGRFDIKAVLSQFAADADIVRLGGDMKRIGREQLASQLELDFYFYRQMQRCAWDATWYHIVAAGDLACLMMELTATFQSQQDTVKIPLHMSASFVRENDQWRISHMHTSPTERSGTTRAQLAQMARSRPAVNQTVVEQAKSAEPSPSDWEDWFERRSLAGNVPTEPEDDGVDVSSRADEIPSPKGAPASWDEWFERTSFG